MKNKISKRILAGILTFGMAATLLPGTVFAAEPVTTKPGNQQLQVEYFDSTLYNWDEDKANAATAEADRAEGNTYQEASVRYNQVATGNTSDYRESNYWHKVGNEYYKVYYTREREWSWDEFDYVTTYTLYYRDGNSYEKIGETTSGYTQITLYEQRQGDYEGKGFYFTAGENKQNSPNFSNWVDDRDKYNKPKQNYYIYSGLAADKLGESANVPFSDAVNAAPLFATDGSNEDYTDVYENVKVPFVYDEETGYYTLDSDANAVYFNGEPKDEAKMAIADRPAAHANSGVSGGWATGFFPFSGLTTSTHSAKESVSDDKVTSYAIDGSEDWGFGMVTSVNFQMTDDGLDANGNPITFEFSGDDDVWVYVDDTLVLDIGGTHDAVLGTINFKTGAVELTAPAYGENTDDGGKTGMIGDMATDPGMENAQEGSMEQTNMYDALGTNLTGFASEGQHTLKIYYMERGQGRSNCLIKFNLPQRDTVSVTKEITKSKTPDGQIDDLTDKEQETVNGWDFGFTLYKDNQPVANASFYRSKEGVEGTEPGATDRNGHFTLKNGETATFLDAIEGSTYYVVEDEPDPGAATEAYLTPEFSYTSDAYNQSQAEAANGFQSMKVTAQGSATGTDTIRFVCENYLNAELPNPSIQPADDLIVIDYGLPISISAERIISNDARRGDSYEITAISGGQYGEAVLSEDHSTITYKLEKQLNGIEEITYTAVAKSGEDLVSAPANGKIKIIPATSMYYEENFGSTTDEDNLISGGMIQYSGQTDDQIVKWVREGSATGGNQETGYVGDASDSTYGTDALYLQNTGDSYGTSRHACADGAAGAAFEYDFTGTGTAIYGRTLPTTGYIEVKVTNTDTNEQADVQYINTRIIGDVAGAEELYNIPIYNNSELEYGNYHVRVYLYKQGTPVNGYKDENGDMVEGSDESGADFYLDGIRVYEPLKGNETAESAYAQDGETNTSVINIHSKLAVDSEAGNEEDIFTLTDKYGNSFMDGDLDNLEDYMDLGPNEEVYLYGDWYNVSFSLVNWDSQRYDLYLGMKSPAETPAKVMVGEKEYTVNNSTDCYYDISDQVTVERQADGTYVGTVAITGVDGLVSLTNIKVTGDYEFDLGYAEDIKANGIDAQTLYLVPSGFFSDKDEEEEDSEEAASFVPENIRITCSYGSKNLKATVTVLTSDDVARLEIDGNVVEPKTMKGKNKYTYSQKNVTAGTIYSIVAYDEAGTASETYTVVAE